MCVQHVLFFSEDFQSWIYEASDDGMEKFCSVLW